MKENKSQLIKEFEEIINDENLNENHIQKFLESHGELIPTPFLLGHQLNFSS